MKKRKAGGGGRKVRKKTVGLHLRIIKKGCLAPLSFLFSMFFFLFRSSLSYLKIMLIKETKMLRNKQTQR